ncbi:Centromere protein V-like 2 [Homarus americanus]|uniref:Centromere protein V-like 2 n=1 Tax=Homarus americanus TaxID=6706 RepID=A0A8J5JPS0_HOMAM|nr:Centromere protein V-like 2 [Homarus americanus]
MTSCSLCVKKQNKHFIVPFSQFKLLKGHDSLTTYSFNTHAAKHNFCSTCGVQPFFIPSTDQSGYGKSRVMTPTVDVYCVVRVL